MSAPHDGREFGTRETLWLIVRSLAFVWPYRRLIAVKLGLSFVGVSVILILPWPLKILVDHVVMGMPVGTAPTPYPPYAQPLLDLMVGLTPFQIVWAIVGISLVGIVLIGAFGQGAASDRAEGELAEGLDTATKSENQANVSDSRVSGLLGLYEYRYQLRADPPDQPRPALDALPPPDGVADDAVRRLEHRRRRCTASCTTRRRSRACATTSWSRPSSASTRWPW